MQTVKFKLKTYDNNFRNTVQLCCGNGRAFYTPNGSALLVEKWSVRQLSNSIIEVNVNFILTGEPKESIEEIYKFLGEYGSVEVNMERDVNEYSVVGGAGAFWGIDERAIRQTQRELTEQEIADLLIPKERKEPKQRTKRVKVLDMNKPRRKFDFEGIK